MTVFCKDCKHMLLANDTPKPVRFATCAKSLTSSPAYLVTGESGEKKFDFCTVARTGTSSDKNCGEDGAWFESALQSAELTFGDQP